MQIFLFKLAQNIVSGAKGAEGALQWTPALLTPHDHYVHMFVYDWMNYHKYKIKFIVLVLRIQCATCALVSVHMTEESMKTEQNVRFSDITVFTFGNVNFVFVYQKAIFPLLLLTQSYLNLNLNPSKGMVGPD